MNTEDNESELPHLGDDLEFKEHWENWQHFAMMVPENTGIHPKEMKLALKCFLLGIEWQKKQQS